MQKEYNIYTGTLKYKEIKFTFVFSNDELCLIPPKEASHEIQFEWLMKKTGPGVYTMGDLLRIEDAYLIGRCNENGQNIIFFPEPCSLIGSRNSVLYVEIRAYIVCKSASEYVSQLSFSSPEINYIHPNNEALSISYNPEEQNGVFELKTRDYESSTTEEHFFLVDGNEVSVRFGIMRNLTTKIGEPPLSLVSTMKFTFKPTNDYAFVLKLWYIAREYVRFLCYRKNVFLNAVKLSAPCEDEHLLHFATLYIVNEDEDNDYIALEQSRRIRQSLITVGESQLLQEIADDRLYLRHLPISYKAGRHIDAARFVMITAAFEWEFVRTHPEGLPKDDKQVEAEEKAISVLEGLISAHTGKEKDIYKWLKKSIGFSSLQVKVKYACEELDPIVGEFGRHLYSMNHEKLSYTEMGKRLADQRNHYAHGDLDKDFIGLALLDLIFLEYIIYAMQLKHSGVDDTSIKKAINELFHLSIAI